MEFLVFLTIIIFFAALLDINVTSLTICSHVC
jgi:hypothetical protein